MRDLVVDFHTETGMQNAVRGVNFDVPAGQVTAIVGESGSGKSVTANAIMRLLPETARISGELVFAPQRTTGAAEEDTFDVLSLADNDPRIQQLRGGLISMVFQEPMTALSPVHRVGDQVAEAILCHRRVSKAEARGEAADMLARVGFDDVERRMRMYPFEFSGGMRQRVVIAMALVCRPQLLICDEPTTALDVTIQAEILVLLRELQRELGNAILFITHDLGVVAQIADRVVVMYQGQTMEIGSVRQVLKDPAHDYTRGLLAAIPGAASTPGGRLATVTEIAQTMAHGPGTVLLAQEDGRMLRVPADSRGTEA